MIPLKTHAIQTALLGDWKSAINLNRELLKDDPNDIETLNRLAFAFTIMGKIKDAKSTYKKVLDLDTHNPIATKNLKRLNDKPVSKNKSDHSLVTNDPRKVANMFIEESGKTKVIDLVNIADPKMISILRTGESLFLSVKRLRVFVLDVQNKYIGVLPDDIGKRLIKFLKGGNHYEAYVKAVENHRVTIFIKETKRAARFKNQPSFTYAPDRSHFIVEKNAPSIQDKHKSTIDDMEDDGKNYEEDESL